MPSVVGRLRTPQLTAAPSSPVKGEVYFDTTTNKLYWYNGTAWVAAEDAGGAGYTLPARLGTACQTISDWNAALDNGWYMSATATNAPVGGVWFYGEVIQHNPSWVTQRVTAFAGDYKTYVRQLQNGTWSSWVPEAVQFQTGIFQTGPMSNSTGYGWNVYYPVAFPSIPRAVICTWYSWAVAYNSVWGPYAINYQAAYFDLYLYNSNQNENMGVRWVALL